VTAASVPEDPRLRLRIVAAFAAIYLVWGSTFLAIRLGVRELPPLLFAGGRFLLAGLLLTLLARWFGDRWPKGAREWRYMLLFSLLMIAVSNGTSSVALQHIPSNEGALLAAGSALWIAFFASLGPQGHRLSPVAIVGLLLGLLGVVLVVWPSARAGDAAAAEELAGHFGWQSLVLLGSLSWSIGTVLYRNARLGIGPFAFNAVLMLAGGGWLVLAGTVHGELPRWHWHPGGLLALVYLAVFGSALAYTAYSWLLQHSSAARVGTFAFVNPAVAAVLGWVVLGERLSATQLAGMAIVLFAVALVTLPNRLARIASAGFSART
jgi:drug/metabolite transporter (DMT)-like permease